MKGNRSDRYEIRPAAPDEYAELGRLTAEAYEGLCGMPGRAEQGEYYAMLEDVGATASAPGTRILAAVTAEGELLGGVTFVGDLRHYNAGDTATATAAAAAEGCAGIRLLAVRPGARGLGVGRALTEACIEMAAESGAPRVILHTTEAMRIAWAMYEKMGFGRSAELDFRQGELAVYGFRLQLPSPGDNASAQPEACGAPASKRRCAASRRSSGPLRRGATGSPARKEA